MKKVLIIEYDEILRLIVSRFLSSENFRVITAENGASGLALAEDQHPDLILCDINMPVLNGYDTLKKLRENPSIAKISFIFLTSATEFNGCCRALELGANGYLVKPIDFDSLLQAINSELNKATIN